MRGRCHFFLALVVAIFFRSRTYSQSDLCTCQEPFKLNTFLYEVVKRNPNLAATRPRIKALEYEVDRVQVWPDPVFTFRDFGHEFTTTGTFFRESHFKFQQRFPIPGKLRMRGEISDYQLTFMQTEELRTHNDLILQAKRFYYYLYFNHVAQEVNKENRIIITRLIESAQALYKTGISLQSDVLKAHVELQFLDDELLSLLSEEATLKAMINAILDREQKTPIGIPEKAFNEKLTAAYETLELLAMEHRPELEGLRALVEKQRTAARLAKREYIPDITLSFLLQRRPKKKKYAWGISVEFDIPLWVSQRQGRERKEAEAYATAHRFELYNLQAVIRGRIKEFLANIKTDEERIALFRTAIIPTLQQTLTSNEANYRVGKGGFLMVIDTRRQLHDAQLAYERARIDREVHLALLEREVGLPIRQLIGKTSHRHGIKTLKTGVING